MRISQYVAEILNTPASPDARLSQYVVEILCPTITPSPTTPTGAGISQYVTEILMVRTGQPVRVSQVVTEILQSIDGGAGPDPGDPLPVTHTFGYAT
jgi:hypothetical protein